MVVLRSETSSKKSLRDECVVFAEILHKNVIWLRWIWFVPRGEFNLDLSVWYYIILSGDTASHKHVGKTQLSWYVIYGYSSTFEWNLVAPEATSPQAASGGEVRGTNQLCSITLARENTQLFIRFCILAASGWCIHTTLVWSCEGLDCRFFSC